MREKVEGNLLIVSREKTSWDETQGSAGQAQASAGKAVPELTG